MEVAVFLGGTDAEARVNARVAAKLVQVDLAGQHLFESSAKLAPLLVGLCLCCDLKLLGLVGFRRVVLDPVFVFEPEVGLLAYYRIDETFASKSALIYCHLLK